MSYVALPLGLVLPTLTGWFLIRLLEWNAPVLFRIERWVVGAILGLQVTMFVSFLLSIAGLMPVTLMGMLSVQIVLTALMKGLYYWKRAKLHGVPHPAVDSPRSPRWFKVLAIVIGVWTLFKLITGGVFLIASPVYFDDTYKNWNLRGKIYYEEEKVTLAIPQADGNQSEIGISSYPPALPLAKAWLATIAGKWSEPVVNSIHLLWFWGSIALVYFALRRVVSWQWAVTGAYILASLPLFVVHGNVAYADVFVAVHVFMTVSFLFFGVREEGMHKRSSFLKLSALAAALLVFTKNETILLHLPPLILLTLISLFSLRNRRKMEGNEAINAMIRLGVMIGAVLLPWLIYKWTHNLEFGNAKGLTGLELGWQPNVLTAFWVNTFFEGNWNLLFPLLIGLLIGCRKVAFKGSLLLITAFILIVYLGQYPIYLFTPLSVEVIMQTGYARGLIHLMPLIVLLVTVLLENLLRHRSSVGD